VEPNGLASSGEPTPLADENALDSEDAQEIAEPQASHMADPNGGYGPDFAASAAVAGLVVNQQTGLAPPNRLSPTQQIADLVANGAGPDNLDTSPITARSSRALDAAGVADSRPSLSRIQTMQVLLDPESLGKVTVSMRLSGTRLDLRVETERLETMQLIGKDKDLLTGKLQNAGYAIETLIVRTADPQAPQQPIGVNVPSNGQDPPTGQANGGPSAHDRPSTQGDRERSRPGPADDAQDGTGVRLTGGDLYL
jgi:chemotaxis protein MotD